MKTFALLLVCAVMAGCAAPSILATTPRSVTVSGSTFNAAAFQQASDAAEAECRKHGRHASLWRTGGTRAETVWQFDCIQ